MARNTKKLIGFILATIVALGGIAAMIVATVITIKEDSKQEYSHNLIVNDVRTDTSSLSGVVYHYVDIEGELKNKTENSFETVDVVINFKGIENLTGEEAVFAYNFVIENLEAGETRDLSEMIIKVGNKVGFIPQSIDSIIIYDGAEEGTIVEFKEESSTGIILFGVALFALFVSGMTYAYTFANKNKEKETI